MAFHLEDGCLTITDVNHTGVFARTLNDPVGLGRKRFEPFFRRLVGAVLRPHDRENAKLVDVGFATHDFENEFVFFFVQAVFLDQFRRDRGAVEIVGAHDAASTMLLNRLRPSVPPCIGSIAFSGWGIMPRTLPASLMMPAMLRCEPFRLVAGSTLPSASQ